MWTLFLPPCDNIISISVLHVCHYVDHGIVVYSINTVSLTMSFDRPVVSVVSHKMNVHDIIIVLVLVHVHGIVSDGIMAWLIIIRTELKAIVQCCSLLQYMTLYGMGI